MADIKGTNYASAMLQQLNKSKSSVKDVDVASGKIPMVVGNYGTDYEALYNKFVTDKNFKQEMFNESARRNELDVYFGLLKQNEGKTLSDNFYDKAHYDYATDMLELSQIVQDDSEMKDHTIKVWDEASQSYKDETVKMTDKAYIQYQINQQREFQDYDIKLQIEAYEKESMDGFSKFWHTTGQIASEFGEGILTAVTGLLDVKPALWYATYNAIFNGESWSDAFVEYYGEHSLTSMEKESVRYALDEWERKYGWVKDVYGNNTSVGGALASISNSFGMMVPSMLINIVAPGSGFALFYVSMFSNNMYENAVNPKLQGAPSWSKILNAGIKSVSQAVIEWSLGKLLGGTLQNSLLGLGGKAGIRGMAKLGKGAAAKLIIGDALQEGLEEFLQDFGDMLIDESFNYWSDGYGNGIDFQQLVDSFIIGAASSMLLAGISVSFQESISAITKGNNKFDIFYETEDGIKKVRGFSRIVWRKMLNDYNSALVELEEGKLSNEQTVEVMTSVYGTYSVLGQYYKQLTPERIQKAQDLLNRFKKGLTDERNLTKQSFEFVGESIRSQYVEQLFGDIQKVMTDAKLGKVTIDKIKKVVKAHEKELKEGDVTKVERVVDNKGKTIGTRERQRTDAQKKVDEEVEKLWAASQKTVDDLSKDYDFLFTTDGHVALEDGKYAFVPESWLENYTASQIKEFFVQSKIVDAIKTDKVFAPIFALMKESYKEFTGTDLRKNTEIEGGKLSSDERVILDTLFNESVFQHFLLKNVLNENTSEGKNFFFAFTKLIQRVSEDYANDKERKLLLNSIVEKIQTTMRKPVMKAVINWNMDPQTTGADSILSKTDLQYINGYYARKLTLAQKSSRSAYFNIRDTIIQNITDEEALRIIDEGSQTDSTNLQKLKAQVILDIYDEKITQESSGTKSKKIFNLPIDSFSENFIENQVYIQHVADVLNTFEYEFGVSLDLASFYLISGGYKLSELAEINETRSFVVNLYNKMKLSGYTRPISFITKWLEDNLGDGYAVIRSEEGLRITKTITAEQMFRPEVLEGDIKDFFVDGKAQLTDLLSDYAKEQFIENLGSAEIIVDERDYDDQGHFVKYGGSTEEKSKGQFEIVIHSYDRNTLYHEVTHVFQELFDLPSGGSKSMMEKYHLESEIWEKFGDVVDVVSRLLNRDYDEIRKRYPSYSSLLKFSKTDEGRYRNPEEVKRAEVEANVLTKFQKIKEVINYIAYHMLSGEIEANAYAHNGKIPKGYVLYEKGAIVKSPITGLEYEVGVGRLDFKTYNKETISEPSETYQRNTEIETFLTILRSRNTLYSTTSTDVHTASTADSYEIIKSITKPLDFATQFSLTIDDVIKNPEAYLSDEILSQITDKSEGGVYRFLQNYFAKQEVDYNIDRQANSHNYVIVDNGEFADYLTIESVKAMSEKDKRDFVDKYKNKTVKLSSFVSSKSLERLYIPVDIDVEIGENVKSNETLFDKKYPNGKIFIHVDSTTSNAELVNKIMHELRHVIQHYNLLESGFTPEFEVSTQLLNDLKQRFPTLFTYKEIRNLLKTDKRIAQEFVYYMIGGEQNAHAFDYDILIGKPWYVASEIGKNYLFAPWYDLKTNEGRYLVKFENPQMAEIKSVRKVGKDVETISEDIVDGKIVKKTIVVTDTSGKQRKEELPNKFEANGITYKTYETKRKNVVKTLVQDDWITSERPKLEKNLRIFINDKIAASYKRKRYTKLINDYKAQLREYYKFLQEKHLKGINSSENIENLVKREISIIESAFEKVVKAYREKKPTKQIESALFGKLEALHSEIKTTMYMSWKNTDLELAYNEAVLSAYELSEKSAKGLSTSDIPVKKREFKFKRREVTTTETTEKTGEKIVDIQRKYTYSGERVYISKKRAMKKINGQVSNLHYVYAPYQDKLLEPEMQDMIEATTGNEDKIEPALIEAIKTGKITRESVDTWFRSTDKMNDYTFNLLNKYLYKNTFFNSLEEIDRVANEDISLWYAIPQALLQAGASLDWLVKQNTLEGFIAFIESAEGSSFKSRIEGIKQRFDFEGRKPINLKEAKKYLRLMIIREFDGTLASANRVAALYVNYLNTFAEKKFGTVSLDAETSTQNKGAGHGGETGDGTSMVDNITEERQAEARGAKRVRGDLINIIELMSTNKMSTIDMSEKIADIDYRKKFGKKVKELFSKLSKNKEKNADIISEIINLYYAASDEALKRKLTYVLKGKLEYIPYNKDAKRDIFTETSDMKGVIEDEFEQESELFENEITKLEENPSNEEQRQIVQMMLRRMIRYVYAIKYQLLDDTVLEAKVKSLENASSMPKDVVEEIESQVTDTKSVPTTRRNLQTYIASKASQIINMIYNKKIVFSRMPKEVQDMFEKDENGLYRLKRSVVNVGRERKTVDESKEMFDRLTRVKNLLTDTIVAANQDAYLMNETAKEVRSSIKRITKQQEKRIEAAKKTEEGLKEVLFNYKRRVVTKTKSSGEKVEHVPVSIKIGSTVDLPEPMIKMFGTAFDETADTKVQFASKDENGKLYDKNDPEFESRLQHEIVSWHAFYDANRETLSSLTREDVIAMKEAITAGIWGQGGFDVQRKVLSFQVFILGYLYQAAQGNKMGWNLSDTEIDELRSLYENLASTLGTGLNAVRQMVEVINPFRYVQQKLLEEYGINEDDSKPLMEAVEKFVNATNADDRKRFGKVLAEEYGKIEGMIASFLENKRKGGRKLKKALKSEAAIRYREELAEYHRRLEEWQEARDRGEKAGTQPQRPKMPKELKSDIAETEFYQKLMSFRYTAMLSNPATWVRNVISNYALSGINKASDTISNAVMKFTKKAAYREDQYDLSSVTKVDKETDAFVEDLLNSIIYMDKDDKKNRMRLFDLLSEGGSKYSDRLNRKTGQELLAAYVTKAIEDRYLTTHRFNNKGLNAVSNFVSKMIGDKKFIEKAFRKYFKRALQIEINKGNIDLNTQMTRKVLDILADSVEMAMRDYMHLKSAFGAALETLREKHPNAYAAINIFMPFMNAGFNWFVEGLRLSPFGLAQSIWKFTRLERAIQDIDERRANGQATVPTKFVEYFVRRNIGKGIIGTALWILGAVLVGIGFIRLDEEDDKFYIYIYGDNIKIDISDIFGSSSLLVGAAIMSGFKGDFKTFDDVMGTTMNLLLDGFIAKDLWESNRWNSNMWEWMLSNTESFMKSFIPQFIQVFVRASNNYKVTYSSGIMGMIQRWLNSFVLTQPFGEKKVNPYTGELQTKYAIPFVGEILKSGMFGIRIVWEDVSEAEKLAKAYGVNKNPLDGTITVKGNKVSLGDKLLLNQYYGKLNAESLANITSQKHYVQMEDGKYKILSWNQMTDAQRQNVIDRTLVKNATYAKIYVWTQIDKHKYYTNEETRKILKSLGITSNVYLGDKGYVE